MAVKKLSISLQLRIGTEIEKRVESGNVSNTVNRSLDRYFALLNRALAEWRGTLSDNECALILDATNGSAFADTISLGMLWSEIEDAVSLDGLDRKWSVDGAALAVKLKASGMLGQAALVDASERWWNRVAAGEQPAYSDLLVGGPSALPYPRGEE
jgi:hypothetical protein